MLRHVAKAPRNAAAASTSHTMRHTPALRLIGLITAALTCSLGGASSAHAADEWPNYRGPSDAGRADAAHLPLRWSEDENVTWKTAVEGKAWSSPVISGDRVYLTNANPEGSTLSALAVDKTTGEIIYNKRLHFVALPQYCHPFNSYASPSPVVEDGRLYVSFGSPYNACLDAATGDVIWQRTDFVCNHFRGAGSSPFLHGDTLYLHFDGSDEQYVVALDKATGETIWRTDRTVDFDDVDPSTGKPEREGDWRKAYSTPIIAEFDGRDALISLGSMALYGYDPEDGRELWRLEFIGSHSGACRPVAANGLLYVPIGSEAELWAIRPRGEGVLTDEHIVWKQDRAVPRRASPVVVGDLLFMVDDSGVGACLDAVTGEERWRERLGGNFSASPIHAGGRLYFFDEDGKATVIAAERDYEVLAENILDDGFMASPAVSGNALFLRTRSHLYRIEDRASGN